MEKECDRVLGVPGDDQPKSEPKASWTRREEAVVVVFVG